MLGVTDQVVDQVTTVVGIPAAVIGAVALWRFDTLAVGRGPALALGLVSLVLVVGTVAWRFAALAG